MKQRELNNAGRAFQYLYGGSGVGYMNARLNFPCIARVSRNPAAPFAELTGNCRGAPSLTCLYREYQDQAHRTVLGGEIH